MNNKQNKDDKLNILAVYTLALLIIVCIFTSNMNELNSATQDLSRIQYLNANTQRAVRLVLMDKADSQLLYLIGKETHNTLDVTFDGHLSVLENHEFQHFANEVIKNWDIIETAVTAEIVDYEVLEITLDSHFDSITSLGNVVSHKVGELNRSSLYLQFVGFAIMLAIGAITVFNYLHSTLVSKQNAELSKLASLDTATGLFNRSKCQELFKSPTKVVKGSLTAIIVIDLNDLKLTNDTLGHRAGDEYILSFSKILKEACNVLEYRPFVGRYGGDEFIVYHNAVDSKKDISNFLKELSFLVDQYNKDACKFKLSYAVGYQINDNNNSCSVRKLFDMADEKMYSNKKLMKDDLRNADAIALADFNNTLTYTSTEFDIKITSKSGKECSMNE